MDYGIKNRASVVVADDVEPAVELDLQTSRKFDLPRIGRALDLPDELLAEQFVRGHEIGDLLRDDGSRNRRVLALDALPRTVGAEIDLPCDPYKSRRTPRS